MRSHGIITKLLSRVLGLALLVGVLAWSGCAGGGYTYLKTISTGERLQFPLVRGQPERAKSGSIQIFQATLLPAPDREKKQVFYVFALTDQSPQPAKSIVIDDVSDETAVTLLDDQKPQFNEHRWLAHSRMYEPNDAGLTWLTYLDDSIRVFRFTVTSATGEKIVLHQAWIVPASLKAAMRHTLGMK